MIVSQIDYLEAVLIKKSFKLLIPTPNGGPGLTLGSFSRGFPITYRNHLLDLVLLYFSNKFKKLK
jgi:hypothetical protein